MTGPAYDPNDPITHVSRAIRLLQAFAPDALPATRIRGQTVEGPAQDAPPFQPNVTSIGPGTTGGFSPAVRDFITHLQQLPGADAVRLLHAVASFTGIGAAEQVGHQLANATAARDPMSGAITLAMAPLLALPGGGEARGAATVEDALNAAERALTAIPHDHAAYETAQAALGRINRAREVGTGVDALGEDAAQHIRNAMTPLQGMQQMGEGHPAFDEALTHLRGALQPAPAPALPTYQGQHGPTGPEGGAPLHDLTGNGQVYPDDVYGPNGVRYYGTGEDALDRESFQKAYRVQGRPDALVRIYRAVPDDLTNADRIAKIERQKAYILKNGKLPPEVDTRLGQSDYYDQISTELDGLKTQPPQDEPEVTINPGDWVTINRNYAKAHGESTLGGNYRILDKTVPAKSIFTNGDSIHEWGYWPGTE